MATLYQLHSSMDTLRRSTEQMALSWQAGDNLLLLGTTVAYIDWLNAYLGDIENMQIETIAGIYALADDVAQLHENTVAKLNLTTKLTGILSDTEWVTMTQDSRFDKVVTIAL
ncbi:MAG: hypothetical protein KA291_09225 [Psychrobacter sp.]|nr:hypothetical protein [Psychrobacter sp.]